MSRWLVVGLENGMFWPTRETNISFRGRDLVLRPETNEFAPDVITTYGPPGTYEGTLRLVRQFLSSLAWVRQGPIKEIGITGGSHPIHIGKGPVARLIDPQFRVDYLPDPEDSRVRLALAFYREALGLDNVAYQFLGFFKIINLLYDKGPDQKLWINKNLNYLEDHHAKERIIALNDSESDIGQYLYESGRCAIAHAFSEPLVDPEDPDDSARLQKDLPLIKALAERLIESELGVKSMHTIWSEHLYQLSGFHSLIGPEIVSKLKEKSEVRSSIVPKLPNLSIRLRGQPHLSAFENLVPEIFTGQEGCLIVDCHSNDNLVLFRLTLNFAEERLEFDAIKGVLIRYDESAMSPSYAADYSRLKKGLCLNGELEVWDTSQESLLGRTDPFIPLNIDTRATVGNLDRQIETFEQLAKERTPNDSTSNHD